MSYRCELESLTARTEWIVLFYRNELRFIHLKELQASERPLRTRGLALRIWGVEGREMPDERLPSDVVERTGEALRTMKPAEVVASGARARDVRRNIPSAAQT